MNRRTLLSLLTFATLVHSNLVFSQSSDRIRRIGVLVTFEAGDQQGENLVKAFREGLREQGWTEGRNLQIEFRHAGSNLGRLGSLAGELAQARVELIVTHGTPAVQAARKAVGDLPIIFATIGDPVGAGLVASLARPGGNITGLSLLASDLSTKRLQLLKEALPHLSRVAMLWNPTNDSLTLQFKETEASARALGVELLSVPAQDISDLERGIKTAAEAQANAIITTSDNLQVRRRAEIVDLAMRHQLPVIAEYSEIAEAGALLSYGPSRQDNWRRAGAYVSKILNGIKPADLPVEQASRFELVINLKSARSLALDLPSSLLIRADEVIE